MLVESHVVIAMTPFDFSNMSWRPRSDTLMFTADLLTEDVQRMTEDVQRMNLVGFPKMSEFKAVVSLNDFWLVSKVFDSHFDKLDSGVGALLFEGENESLSGGLVYHRVLVKLIK